MIGWIVIKQRRYPETCITFIVLSFDMRILRKKQKNKRGTHINWYDLHDAVIMKLIMIRKWFDYVEVDDD